MTELQRIAQKFEREADQLIRLLDRVEDANSARLALIEAKRARRECTLLVRHLASFRDHATAQEAQAHEHR